MNNINKTMYIPLYGKAYVSQKGIILQDKKAEYIWKKEGFELKGKAKSKWLSYFMSMRAKVFDEWVEEQLENTTNPVVVHIGCGMDSRIQRLSPYCQWYDLDNPYVIKERKKYFSETEKYHMIASDVLKTDWIKCVPETNAIIIFEGVSMYINESSMRDLLRKLNSHFLSVKILMDCYTESGEKTSKYKNPVGEVGVKYWAINGYKNPQILENTTGLEYIKEHRITPVKLINELQGLERFIFKHIFAGKFARSLYKIYEYKRK